MNISRLPGEWAEEAVQGIAAAQLNPSLLDLIHIPRLIVQIGHADLDVDDRLGEQPWNSRGPTCSIRGAVAPSCLSRRSRHRS